ncbi:transposase [Candidatus Regiella insecticola]|uniref:Mobile element protein n=1 Tax=Candidatus Regiella insecticola TaxID=138073 RepID=A0A6L2ZQ55_9ENTR|nr:transposase [Candidatus Regiella insecticola]GFN46997.1 mobile element protein [Candidatus Regiella insecticola]
MQEKVNLLTSIPGIGQQTALMILTLLPEIASSENKSLAALVGVAPFIQGGRKTLRKALYMAAVASVRWNKPLADFYHRLRAKGKCGKVAIVAVMHKLLSMVSSVYKRKSPWVENLA